MNWTQQGCLAASGFVVGASVGSFLNVCIWRIPRGESVVRPASRCPDCSASIGARDNVPILSWLALRGRCRACGCAISRRYPLVEGLVGLLFGAVVLSECVTGTHDLFDLGPLDALLRIGYLWALVALLVTASMIEHDRLREGGGVWLGRSSAILARPVARLATPCLAMVVTLGLAVAGDPLASALNFGLLAVFLRSRRAG